MVIPRRKDKENSHLEMKRSPAKRRGHPISEETKEKIRAALAGRKLSDAHRTSLVAAHKNRNMIGENNPCWRGGLTKDLRAYKSEWEKRNRSKVNQWNKSWRQRNPEKFSVLSKRGEYKRRALILNAIGNYSHKEWEDLKRRYDFECLACHRKEPEIILTVDHIIPLSQGGSNYIENIQPLCRSCNCRKKDHTANYKVKSLMVI